MAMKSAPTAGKANVQSIFVVIEEESGVLQKPTAADYVVPAGNASISQTPGTTPSEELSESLNTIDLFQNAVDPGEASFPMYVRIPVDGKMQGHSVLLAAMGDVQEPETASCTATVDGTDGTEITVTGLSGIFPPRGVLSVGDEKILYTGLKTSQGEIIALTGCERGYMDTTAAAHDGVEAKLASRVWTQDIVRHTVSIWTRMDNLVMFGSGGVVTNMEVSLSRESGQGINCTMQFRRLGWAGRSFVSGTPSGAKVAVLTKGGEKATQAYTVGGYIQNSTKKDDNGGEGYRIVAFDDATGTITLEKAPSGWAEGDQLDGWLPTASPIGEALESRDARVFVGGKTGRIREGTLTIGTPAEFLAEIGEEYPGESVDTKREITIGLNGYLRADDARELGRGYDGYEVPVAVRLGRKEGQRLAFYMPRVKMTMPSISTTGAVFTLDRDASVLGTKGEDALYIVQE